MKTGAVHDSKRGSCYDVSPVCFCTSKLCVYSFEKTVWKKIQKRVKATETGRMLSFTPISQFEWFLFLAHLR